MKSQVGKLLKTRTRVRENLEKAFEILPLVSAQSRDRSPLRTTIPEDRSSNRSSCLDRFTMYAPRNSSSWPPAAPRPRDLPTGVCVYVCVCVCVGRPLLKSNLREGHIRAGFAALETTPADRQDRFENKSVRGYTAWCFRSDGVAMSTWPGASGRHRLSITRQLIG